MSELFEEYARYFPPGVRVRVGIPLATGGMFQEWGVVASMEEDLLLVRLSRDLLPEEANLDIGRTLQLRVIRQGVVRFSRGIVVSEQVEHICGIRLIQGVVIDEPREFYRHEVFLPVEYHLPPSQDEEEIRTVWKEMRWAKELAHQQPEPGESEEVAKRREELKEQLLQHDELPPRAANMSGGGLRIVLPEPLALKSLVNLTIYLPQPKTVLDLVGEVVAQQELKEGAEFSTAFRFRFIEERDRDRIVAYISAEQLAHLARMRGGAAADYQPGSFFSGRGYKRRIALLLVILIGVTAFLARSIVTSRARGEKHEIERVFEDGVMKYLGLKRRE